MARTQTKKTEDDNAVVQEEREKQGESVVEQANEANEANEVNEVKNSKKPSRLIYIGPNIPGGELDQFDIFKGGMPEYLAVVKNIPEIKGLFIPVDRLAEARQNLAGSGTKEARLFQLVKEKTEKKGG